MVIVDLEHLGLPLYAEAVHGGGSASALATSSTLVIGEKTIAKALTLALAQTMAGGGALALSRSRSSALASSL